jgi:hypothetical protein
MKFHHLHKGSDLPSGVGFILPYVLVTAGRLFVTPTQSKRFPGSEKTLLKSDHPETAELERFFRGELPREEVHPLVRHLLAGCPACREVTRRLWELGEKPVTPLPTPASAKEDSDS